MKKIFTFLLGIFFCTMLMAQRPEAIIQKAGDVKPVIDGKIDAVWTTVTKHNVTLPFRKEVPTLGPEGTTYWKALWDMTGMYIIIVANDDKWYPYFGHTDGSYLYDKIELYFDTNYTLLDGVGGQGGTTGNRQIAPDPTDGKLNGELLKQTIQGGDVQYCYKLDGNAWTTEWFIPWESIPDKSGNLFDKTATMGFDVDITDNDNDGQGRKRAMWANVGAVDEDWNNMDDAGHITLQGAEAAINIDAITISGGAPITVDNGTVQFAIALSPANATQAYKWNIVGGTGQGTISKTGLLQAVRNGTVIVQATSSDGFVASNEITINVSGQVVTPYEASYILDGDFKGSVGAVASSNWQGGAVIENGIMTITNPTAGTNPWDFTVGQTINIPDAKKNLPFVLEIKAWADADRIFDIDIENVGGSYTRFGDSPDPKADAGHSQWRFNLTTTPTVYDLEITNFSRLEALPQKFNLFAGMATPKVYIQHVFLVEKTDFVSSAQQLQAPNSLKVYPNPVGEGNQIFVEMGTANKRVAIYNAVGQLMIEKMATGTIARFDVGTLPKGIYFIKLDDGTSQKFIR